MEENIIETKDLVKKYGDFTAVNNLNFNVKKGEIFAFLGPNGAGKTTTIKMLTTLTHPTSGEIKLNGFNPVDDPHKARASLGIVFQDPSLDNELTAYENMEFHAILYGLKDYKKRIAELLNLVELSDRRNSFVKKFSGGMKRRLEIARGLLHEPKILFLDEPTIGLDPQTRNHIWTHIKNLNKQEQVTIFFTTHHMEEVERMAQRVAIIDHGKILIIGTIDDILKKAGTKRLEDAFIALTGSTIREESANVGLNQMRINNRLMR
jgi:ABC-2 type transport system ATP-binding protein